MHSCSAYFWRWRESSRTFGDDWLEVGSQKSISFSWRAETFWINTHVRLNSSERPEL